MTLMLTSVLDGVEAKLALEGGADIIDFSDCGREALGSVPIEKIAAAISAVGKSRPISAALGAQTHSVESVGIEAQAKLSMGVDLLRILIDTGALNALGPTISALARKASLIGVLLADRNPDFALIQSLARLGVKGVQLDVTAKDGKRLLDYLPPTRIEAFCRACREAGVAAWLAGSLQSPDIPRLMLVEPDVLGFRTALCARGRRSGPLDPQRIALIRDLIPQGRPLSDGRSEATTRIDEDGHVAGLRAAAAVGEQVAPVDAIFVHDFLMTGEIGAYAHERGTKQRLLFNIDASVGPIAAHADDMRAIVSYDIILDAVRIVVGRGHFDFIETVAEEVAAIVLKHPRVVEVRVRVEKLDVVAGSVGVEIARRRVAPQPQ
jgi:dihydroneopterin aldolase